MKPDRLGLRVIAILLWIAAVGVCRTDDTPAAMGVWSMLSVAALIWQVSFMRRKDSWKGDPASDRQKQFADDLGIDYDPRISKGALSALIDEAKGDERE